MKRKIRHIPVRFVKTYYMNGMRIDLYVDGDSEDGRFSVRDKEVKITIGIGNMSWANALGVLMHEVVELMWHCERCRYAKTRKGSDSIDGLMFVATHEEYTSIVGFSACLLAEMIPDCQAAYVKLHHRKTK